MTGRRRLARVPLAALALAALSACVFPHRMERAGPPGGACPERGEPPAVAAPPDTTLLRWYRSGTSGDRERAAPQCRTVGAPVFRGRPTGAFPDWRVGDSLSVVSWSMQVGAGDLPALIGTELGLECEGSRSALRPGQPQFVLLLQSAYRTSPDLPAAPDGREIPRAVDPDRAADEDVVRVAERCGLALHYVASGRNGSDSGPHPTEDRGNAILSTLPLTIPIAIELPLEASRAVAVAATLVMPGDERLRVVSTHVDGLSTLARTLIGGNQARARQVSGLVDGLDQADDDGPLNAATLVGADLGVWDDNETAVRVMRRAFPESPAWDGLRSHGRFSADHIFFRRGSFLTITVGSYRRLDGSHGSSHQPRRVVVNYFPVRGSG